MNKKLESLYVKDVLPKNLTIFLTHLLMREHHARVLVGAKTDDEQVEGSMAVTGHSVIFDTVLERVWPFMESILGEELIPTYSYARLYVNGNELKIHKDRPSCEVSITIQLGRSHHYSWPIYMGEQRYDLAEGDGIIYNGVDISHYRKPADGPEGYYSGQLFLHYVRANGSNKKYAGDQRWDGEMPFIKFRTADMETK